MAHLKTHVLDVNFYEPQCSFSIELPKGSNVLEFFQNPLRELCLRILESNKEITEIRNFTILRYISNRFIYDEEPDKLCFIGSLNLKIEDELLCLFERK